MLALMLSKCFAYYSYQNKTNLTATIKFTFYKLSCKIQEGEFVFATLQRTTFANALQDYPEAFGRFQRKSMQLDFNCYYYCTFSKADIAIEGLLAAESVWHISKFLGVVLGSIFGGLFVIGAIGGLVFYIRRKK